MASGSNQSEINQTHETDGPTINSQESRQELVPITSVAASPSEPDLHQVHRPSSDTNDGLTPPTYKRVVVYLTDTIAFVLSHLCSMSDGRTIVRFAVVIFSFLMGIWTTLSVSIMPRRPEDALPSLNDDSHPIMVAQVAASMLSPLLFTVVSTKKDPTPVRRKITSFYYLLLALGVLMSLASLLFYSLWPSGYRVTNVTILASMMFGVLGGWQFLERSWKTTSSINEDVELDLRQA
ncbi:uncharacterized protein F4812DRAFT_419252 [Daldinia caldariorum]|uniref:uncharacterized protein n=1 Tax=Daldinia caldariorum TaxID=326644 RepID=UPI0020087694|nr:uncharacterized protein F4812DRAFT_419252 [Daldinia caldariorum]KAI1470860.1 hypothetical protein F4812DRAFT_419252 [Daldinia caldariorum]